MKKFLHIVYIILMRILMFVGWIVFSPFCILLAVFAAVASLFGAFDDMYDSEHCVKYEEKYTEEEIATAKKILEGDSEDGKRN